MGTSGLTRLLRGCLAAALACSWLLLAGLPASAIVTGASVESPKPGAALKTPKPLIVGVDRTTATDDGKIRVFTRLLYGGTPAPPEPEPEPSEEPSPEPETQGEEESGPDSTTQQQQPGQTKPVSKIVLGLKFIGAKPAPPAGERLRFGGVIDPHNLGWLPQGGTGRNGQYTLEYLVDSSMSDSEEWRRFEFRLDAPPPPQGAPGVGVQDAAAKRIIVAWNANTAPDLTGYTIERRRGSGQWRVAQAKVDADQTQITDTVGDFGSYQYRVKAIRPAGDGSKDVRTTTSLPSQTFTLTAPSDAAPRDSGATDDGTGTGTDGDGDPTTVPPVPGSPSSGGSVPSASGPPATGGFGTTTEDMGAAPGVAAPPGFQDKYDGPLDYDVAQESVTERVPIGAPPESGTTAQDGGTLTMLDRAIDQQRVLPPLAGGLILVLSAAHVLRYLNE